MPRRRITYHVSFPATPAISSPAIGHWCGRHSCLSAQHWPPIGHCTHSGIHALTLMLRPFMAETAAKTAKNLPQFPSTPVIHPQRNRAHRPYRPLPRHIARLVRTGLPAALIPPLAPNRKNRQNRQLPSCANQKIGRIGNSFTRSHIGNSGNSNLRRKRRKITPQLWSSPAISPHMYAEIGRIGNCFSHHVTTAHEITRSIHAASLLYCPLRLPRTSQKSAESATPATGLFAHNTYLRRKRRKYSSTSCHGTIAGGNR